MQQQYLSNSLCLCAQAVQVNTKADGTSTRRGYRGERRQSDEHIGCARAALHERSFCAHPNAYNTQTVCQQPPPPVWGASLIVEKTKDVPILILDRNLLGQIAFRAIMFKLFHLSAHKGQEYCISLMMRAQSS